MPPDVTTLNPAAAVTDLLLPLAQSVPSGPWVSWWKILIVVLFAVVWLRLMLWVDKDSTNARMPREAINTGLFAAFALGLVLVIALPFFPLALAAFALLGLASIGGYLLWRRSVVGLEDIPEQLGDFFKSLAPGRRARGPKKKHEDVPELGIVTLLDAKGNAPPRPAEDDPARPGYDTAHRVLADPLYKNAERVVLLPVAGGASGEGARYATKYSVDGHDYAGSAFDEGAAAAAVSFLKELAGLDAGERRKVQVGKMKARTASGVSDLEVASSGTRTGEALRFEVDKAGRYKDRASALGFTQAQREILDEVVREREGLVLAAAPKGGGLDALLYGLLLEHDAFTQHILTAERPIRRELEGVTQQAVPDDADPESERKTFSWIADQLPDVFLTDRVSGKGSAGEIVRLANDERRAYVGVRAGDTAAAVAEWLKVHGEPKKAVAPLRLAVAGRVMRRLCDACKIGYEPGEAALAKMGVPKGKVSTLYKARTEPMLDQRGNPVTCEFCGGLGYKGRVGAFEVLPVDAEARRNLLKDASSSTVRNLLRAAKLPTLNEAALRQVIAGRTDLQEVQRVMSATSGGGGGSPSSRRPPKSPKSPKPSPAAA